MGNTPIPMEKKAKIVEEVNRLRKTGLSSKEATKKMGIHCSQYYGWIQKGIGKIPVLPTTEKKSGVAPEVIDMTRAGLKGKKRAYNRKPASPLFQDIHFSNNGKSVAIILGTAEDVKSVLQSLSALRQ